ncbi:MAG: hypothetical protein ACI959_000640, partial [Limisphaerales bacterium]
MRIRANLARGIKYIGLLLVTAFSFSINAKAFSVDSTSRMVFTAVDDLFFTSEDFTVPLNILNNDLGDIDTSTVIIIRLPNHGSAVYDSLIGRINYTPSPNYNGLDTMYYSVEGSDGTLDTASVNIVIYPTNDVPFAVTDSQYVLIDLPLLFNPLANDSDSLDPSGGINTSSISIVTPPQNGFVFVIILAGNIGYSSSPGYIGSDSLEYEVCDLGNPLPAECATGWVYFDVVDSIRITTPAPTLCEGDSLQLNVSGVGPLSWTPTTGLSCTDCADPWVSTTSTTTYTVSSSLGGCCPHSDQITVTVNPFRVINAVNDTLNITEDQTDSIDIGINDLLTDGVFSIHTGPASGSATLIGEMLSYVPAADFNGSVSLQYISCPLLCGTCDTAELVINIDAVNDVPFINPDFAAVSMDLPVDINVIDNDNDVDGNIDTSTLSVITLPVTGSLGIDLSTGIITYTPVPGFEGVDSFEYQICDDGTPLPAECGTAWVIIDIPPEPNDAPVATFDIDTVFEDSFVSINVVINDFDPEAILDTSSMNILGGPFFGTASVLPTGEILYTPNPDYYGNDSLKYRICDSDIDVLCDVTAVFITVLPINDPPIVVDDTALGFAGSPVVIDILDNDSDIDGNLDNSTFSLLTPPSNGLAIFDTLTGMLNYTADPGYSGGDSLQYEICDDGTPLPSACDQAWLVFVVDDTTTRFPPTAVDDIAGTTEDNFVNIQVDINDFDTVGTLDPSTITILIAPVNGMTVPGVLGSVVYTPNPDFFGIDSFNYSICNTTSDCDNAWVVITVSPENDAPVAVNDLGIVDMGDTLDVAILDNDFDVDSDLDTSSVIILSAPVSGSASFSSTTGLISYIPTVGFTGSDSLQYQVCDAGSLPILCDDAWLIITVRDTSDLPPVAVVDFISLFEDDSTDVFVALNDIDPAGLLDTTSAAIVIGPINGTASRIADGQFRYIPDANFFGEDSFRYSICNTLLLCDEAWVFLTVDPINDAPFVTDDIATTDIGDAVSTAVLDNDFDIDGNLDTATFSFLDAPNSGIAFFNPVSGILIYTPDPGFVGSDSLQYQICDDGTPLPAACGNAWVVFTVLDTVLLSIPPIAVDDIFNVLEDGSAFISVLDNDLDPQSLLDTSSVVILGGPDNGSISIDVNGIVNYIPNANFNGIDSFLYSVCNTLSPPLCDDAWVVINVEAVNDPPTAVEDFGFTAFGTAIPISVLANDYDIDGNLDTALFSFLDTPNSGIAFFSPVSGILIYTPDAGFVGSDSLLYQICDDGTPLPSACASAWVYITTADSNAIDLAPIAINDTVVMLEDELQDIYVAYNDNDPEGLLDTASISMVRIPSNGGAVLGAGFISYAPDQDFWGLDSFSYSICHLSFPVQCDTAWVILNISPVNDFPVASDDTGIGIQDETVLI